jgi:LysM repeat protein
MSNGEYVQKYRDDAIRDMRKMGVPASITLAQGILESDAGNSELAREANNHFGIKCHKDWTGPFYIKDDDTKDECFRKYKTVLESFDDHGRFLRERPRYAFLFELDVTDYEGWAKGLKKAGYATNPRYAELLIRIIEENNLHQYDKSGKRLPVGTNEVSPVAKQTPPSSSPPTASKAVKRRKTSKTKPASPAKVSASNAVNSNQVPFVTAGKDDSWYSVAVAHQMRLWQILKYNDAEKNDVLNEGDIVYLKPKRGRPAAQFHTVTGNENLRSIAQKHGVKLKQLIKLNKFEESVSVTPGQQIKLK